MSMRYTYDLIFTKTNIMYIPVKNKYRLCTYDPSSYVFIHCSTYHVQIYCVKRK